MRFLKNHENGKNSTPVQFLGLKIGPDQDYMVLHNRKIQIFDFSIFFKIMAFFRSKMAKISIATVDKRYLGKGASVWFVSRSSLI